MLTFTYLGVNNIEQVKFGKMQKNKYIYYNLKSD